MSNDTESSPQIQVSVQFEDFNLGIEYQGIKNRDQGQGAVVTFSGLVRDNNLGQNVTGLYLEHYTGMTQKCLVDICEQACKRWELAAVTVIHRVGELSLNEQIVFVGVSAKHRKSAFQGCEFIMDYLKTQAPFWKKERFADGEAWVEAKQSDQQAANKW